jgi:hypothetical protein
MLKVLSFFPTQNFPTARKTTTLQSAQSSFFLNFSKTTMQMYGKPYTELDMALFLASEQI